MMEMMFDDRRVLEIVEECMVFAVHLWEVRGERVRERG